jgi:uncharacterized protein YndB with AHSA1/START domain
MGDVRIYLSGPEWLVVEMDVPSVGPDEALRWFTQAELLNRWWGEEALIEPRPGGMFVVHWPTMGWTMRGTVGMVSDTVLMWSWAWAHEPDAPARAVVVEAVTPGEQTTIRVTHGPYRAVGLFAEADAQERRGHLEGWLQFLPDLAKAIASNAATRVADGSFSG